MSFDSSFNTLPSDERLCPTCGADSQSKGTARKTLASGQSGYDENDVYHNHDPNWTSRTMECENGHSWTYKTRSSCPADGCDFGGETKKVAHND